MMKTDCGVAPMLRALGRAGVELVPHPTDPARLRFRPVALAPELIDGLSVHRGPILALLGDPFNPTDAEAGYVYRERLGAADGLELSTHPGAPAWAVAVGEAMEAGR